MPQVDGLAGGTEQAGDLGLGVFAGLEQGSGAHPTGVKFLRGTKVLGELHAL